MGDPIPNLVWMAYLCNGQLLRSLLYIALRVMYSARSIGLLFFMPRQRWQDQDRRLLAPPPFIRGGGLACWRNSLKLTQTRSDSLKLAQTIKQYRSNSLELAQTRSNSLKPKSSIAFKLAQTRSDSLKLAQAHSNPPKLAQTHSNSLKLAQTRSNSLRLAQTRSNPFKPLEVP